MTARLMNALPYTAFLELPRIMLDLQYFKDYWGMAVEYFESPVGDAEVWLDVTCEPPTIICMAKTEAILQAKLQQLNSYIQHLKDDLKVEEEASKVQEEACRAASNLAFSQVHLKRYNRCVLGLQAAYDAVDFEL